MCLKFSEFKEICNNRYIHVTVLKYQHCATESIEAYLYNFHNLLSMTVLFPKLQLAEIAIPKSNYYTVTT